MKLLVVTVSVREARVGNVVGTWMAKYAQEHGGFDEVETIDLKELNLPVFDEPQHPFMQQYTHDHTKRWSQIADSADAYVFVTPEYDYFVPGAFVNAVDYLAKEWNYKPAAIVGYGGASGGMRSIQSVKPLLTTVKMMPLPESVTFHFVNNYIQDGELKPEDQHTDTAKLMLDELAKWGTALRPLRDNPGTDDAE